MRKAKNVMKLIGNDLGGSSNTFISYNIIIQYNTFIGSTYKFFTITSKTIIK